MSGHATRSDGEIGFQLAPMIDLILVLLVFFMLVAAGRPKENLLSVDTHGDGKHPSPHDIVLTIGIDPDGSVNLDNLPLAAMGDRAMLRLHEKLKEQKELFGDQTPVLIAPQPDVPHQRVMDVLNACAASGMKNLSFSG